MRVGDVGKVMIAVGLGLLTAGVLLGQDKPRLSFAAFGWCRGGECEKDCRCVDWLNCGKPGSACVPRLTEPVTVTLYSFDGCGPCRAYKPTFAKQAGLFPAAKFATVNGITPGITAYPCVIVRRGESEVARFTGAVSDEQLKEAIERK